MQQPKCFWKCLQDCCKRQNAFFSLARLLQTPKTTFFHLQDCCKRQNAFFSLARLLQAPKTTFSYLQDCCKRQKLLFPICKTVVSISKSPMAVAARYRDDSETRVFFPDQSPSDDGADDGRAGDGAEVSGVDGGLGVVGQDPVVIVAEAVAIGGVTVEIEATGTESGPTLCFAE